jgi:pimeloyl-ACP methyl ester carboxylesterase
MTRKALLACGIVSSLLYVAMTIVIAMRWPGYSALAQTVSELSAIGAPTRSAWVPAAALYTILVTAFGFGVWRSAGGERALRTVGGLIVAYGALGLIWPFAPMHLRETLAAGGGTVSDTLHVTLGIVTVVLMLSAITAGTAAFGERFRFYSVASLIVLVIFGAATFADAPRVGANLPTPWVGLWERINIGVFLVWVSVLAVMLWRTGDAAAMIQPSSFKTTKSERAFLAAYDAAMKSWPVSYGETQVLSRFGITHVVVSGPEHAPPLVLLHGYMATLTMWAPNVAALSRDYRVYAVDVMGQPGKSVAHEPIRTPADWVAWMIATLNGLHLDRVFLAGMSYGGWLALNFAVAEPERVQKLVLLSPAASFLPLVRQFFLRGMPMMTFPTHLTVNAFMQWLGFRNRAGDGDTKGALELMYLGMKHFRIARPVAPTVFSDDELVAMRVPTLLLMGEQEVIYNAAKALARARRLLPRFEGALVPQSSHDMCVSQHRTVDARMLDFMSPAERTIARPAA